MTEPSAKLSVKEKLAYAMGDASANIAWRGVGTFLFVFYTDVMGLLPAAVGTLMLVIRLSDGVSDALMGIAADRTRTRWGRYRPWMLWGAIPLGVTLSLSFTCPESLGMTGRLVWAYVTYLLFTLAYTAQAIPYGALLSVISPDERERTSAGSYKMAGAFTGGLIVQSVLLLLKEHFDSYSIPIYILSAVLVVLMPITFFGTRERVTEPPERRGNLKKDLSDLVFRNRPWVIMLLVCGIFYAAVAAKQSVTVMYFAHYLGREVLCATYFTAISVVAVGGAALTSPLAARFGKRALFVFSLAAFAVLSAAQFLCSPTDVAAVFATGALAEFVSAIFNTLCFIMLGDIADYAEWRNGSRPSGLVYSGVSFVMKACTGLAGLLVGVVLAAYGYDGKAPATIPGALPGITGLMSWIPGALCALAAALMCFYPITTAMLGSISAELAERRKRNEDQGRDL